LLKPLRSAGGREIHIWSSAAARQIVGRPGPWYWQQRIVGRPCSAAFVASATVCRLWGLTRQLVGARWTGAGPWQYCGSLGPSRIDPAARRTLTALGQALCDEFGLRGAFGVDLIHNRQGYWPIEINPRFTASMELYDWAYGRSTVFWHLAACRNAPLPAPPAVQPGCFGKAIVYAPSALRAPDGLWDRVRTRSAAEGWPAVADVPLDGTLIPAGGPIATVFARAACERSVLAALRARARWLRAILGAGRSPRPRRELGSRPG
jgi:predicted ATP-grasp superfamily ATP-dependent carboligase